MEPLGNRSWKEYYSQERISRSKIIDESFQNFWDEEDPSVEEILKDGGILSFPHTYLDTSLVPTIRTVRAILKNDINEIAALGVLHRISGLNTENEFSLDTFKYVLDRACALLDRPKPRLIEIYLPKERIDRNKPDETIEQIEMEIGLHLKGLNSDVGFVMTGDLAHYGNYYGTTDPKTNPDEKIYEMIRSGLDLIFVQGKIDRYFAHALLTLNDQIGPAIAAKVIIGKSVNVSLFNREMSDYSEVFQVAPPCKVASIFYGISPSN